MTILLNQDLYLYHSDEMLSFAFYPMWPLKTNMV